jgi:rubrerythrin
MAVYSINEIIEMAVQIERNGYAFYNEASKRKDLDDKSCELITRNWLRDKELYPGLPELSEVKPATELIIWLRDQELEHEKSFLALRDDVELKSLELSQDWELVALYLKTIVEGRIFNSEDSAIRRAIEAKNLAEIIDYAISFEKDTLLYFQTISNNISYPKAIDVLHKIINEEISHIIKLADFKKNLS